YLASTRKRSTVGPSRSAMAKAWASEARDSSWIASEKTLTARASAWLQPTASDEPARATPSEPPAPTAAALAAEPTPRVLGGTAPVIAVLEGALHRPIPELKTTNGQARSR